MVPANSVNTREDFVSFARDLSARVASGEVNVENPDLDRYLEAVSAWTTDMDGYFANRGEPVPPVSWRLFAMILEAAVVYE